MSTQKIATFLWFDAQAEDAARLYCSLIKNSRVTHVTPGPTGSPMVVEFELAGVTYLALNGGPHFKLSEAVSLVVYCEDQAEIDFLWDKLSEGGAASQCGWLKDRFGLSWQIVPETLPRLIADPQRAGRVMQALMTMTKIDSQKLQDAYDGAS